MTIQEFVVGGIDQGNLLIEINLQMQVAGIGTCSRRLIAGAGGDDLELLRQADFAARSISPIGLQSYSRTLRVQRGERLLSVVPGLSAAQVFGKRGCVAAAILRGQ